MALKTSLQQNTHFFLALISKLKQTKPKSDQQSTACAFLPARSQKTRTTLPTTCIFKDCAVRSRNIDQKALRWALPPRDLLLLFKSSPYCLQVARRELPRFALRAYRNKSQRRNTSFYQGKAVIFSSQAVLRTPRTVPRHM